MPRHLPGHTVVSAQLRCVSAFFRLASYMKLLTSLDMTGKSWQHEVMPTDDGAPINDPSLPAAGWDGDDIAEMQGAREAERKYPFEALGHVVVRERSRRGWTAEEAAKRAKISYKTWLRIEHGEPVRNATLMKVDTLFGLSPGTALDVWQRGDEQALEAALMLYPVKPEGVTDEDIARLIASLPKPSEMSTSARMLMIRHGFDAIVETVDPKNKRRAIYETLIALINTLDSDDLDAVQHVFEVAQEVRRWESSIGMPTFALSFHPDPVKYAKVVDPWSEYRDGEFEVKVSAGKLTEMTADKAQEVVLRMREEEDGANSGE